MSPTHRPRVTNFERLWNLCEQLPVAYRDQSRARLGPSVERMTLREADERLNLRLDEYGALPCDDHEDGIGCSDSCRCMGYHRG